MVKQAEPDVIDPNTAKRTATYSLPWAVWAWLKAEAERRETDASALIADLVRKEQEQVAA